MALFPVATCDVQLSCNGELWLISRRFSDFDQLHSRLTRRFGDLIEVGLPEKQWFGRYCVCDCLSEDVREFDDEENASGRTHASDMTQRGELHTSAVVDHWERKWELAIAAFVEFLALGRNLLTRRRGVARVCLHVRTHTQTLQAAMNAKSLDLI